MGQRQLLRILAVAEGRPAQADLARARVIAGGTDLLGKMKDEILPMYPEAIVNLLQTFATQSALADLRVDFITSQPCLIHGHRALAKVAD